MRQRSKVAIERESLSRQMRECLERHKNELLDVCSIERSGNSIIVRQAGWVAGVFDWSLTLRHKRD